ncbi:MAG: hypothetical protein D6781_11715 [Verrucomicrobia bacterium]|nr:MAG: hypothetical protein D6781_11715 [Verrucomicrobiota bacterium]
MNANRQRWMVGAGVLPAVAASLCCLGPIITLALGLGGFAAAAWFAEYRPWFLGLTALLLGTAWGQALLRRRACAADDCRRGRRSLILLSLATVTALLFGAYPWIAGSRPARAESHLPPATADSTAQTVHFSLPTMDCPACARHIAGALRSRRGVLAASVDYDTRSAHITFDPARTSPAALADAIAATGFPATPSPPDDPSP